MVAMNSKLPPPAPLTVAPLTVKLPAPAVELPSKSMLPPLAPLTVAPLVVKVPEPAVELSTNVIVPALYQFANPLSTKPLACSG
ncbi:MAG: hypothetical protein ABSH19_04605 [Opitutales bacterium]